MVTLGALFLILRVLEIGLKCDDLFWRSCGPLYLERFLRGKLSQEGVLRANFPQEGFLRGNFSQGGFLRGNFFQERYLRDKPVLGEIAP